MRKVRTGKDVRLFKIELNGRGDFIEVPVGDEAFFDRFSQGCKQMYGIAGGSRNKLKKIERKYKKLETTEAVLEKIEEEARVQVQFSKRATDIIDNIFGEGTVRKYFRKFYEEDPGFMPNVECFTDFLEQVTPVMKKLSGRRCL